MRRDVPVPESISECPVDNGVRIICRWNRHTAVFGALLFFWCAVIAIGSFCYIGLPEKSGMVFDVFRIPVPILVLAFIFTVIIAYGLIAKFVNTTEIRINATEVEIGIQPLPWIGSGTVSIRRSEIIRLFVQEQSKVDSYGRVVKTHDLCFVDPHGRHRHFIRFLQVHEALYLRVRLGEILGLDDLSVGGAACA